MNITEEEKLKFINAGDKEYIFENETGKIGSNIFYDISDKANEYTFRIHSNYLKGWNLININTRKLLCNEWYRYMVQCYDEICVVRRAQKPIYNFIKLNGELLLDNWVPEAYSFIHGTGLIRMDNGTYYMVDKNGNLLYCHNDSIEYNQNANFYRSLKLGD